VALAVLAVVVTVGAVMTERISRMKLVACVLYGTCLGLIAGFMAFSFLVLRPCRGRKCCKDCPQHLWGLPWVC
jgi:hypothetical protein